MTLPRVILTISLIPITQSIFGANFVENNNQKDCSSADFVREP